MPLVLHMQIVGFPMRWLNFVLNVVQVMIYLNQAVYIQMGLFWLNQSGIGKCLTIYQLYRMYMQFLDQLFRSSCICCSVSGDWLF